MVGMLTSAVRPARGSCAASSIQLSRPVLAPATPTCVPAALLPLLLLGLVALAPHRAVLQGVAHWARLISSHSFWGMQASGPAQQPGAQPEWPGPQHAASSAPHQPSTLPAAQSRTCSAVSSVSSSGVFHQMGPPNRPSPLAQQMQPVCRPGAARWAEQWVSRNSRHSSS